MKNPKAFIDCSITTLAFYLIFSMLMVGLDSITLGAAALYIIFPLLCLSCGVFCGSKNGIQLHYPLLAGVLFVPAMLLFFDLSIWSFAVVYTMLAILGEVVGWFFQKNTSGRHSNGRLR